MDNYEIMNNKTGVLIHAGVVEEKAKQQIDLIVKHPAIRGLVAIMPDVHAGAGCVIGFTGKFNMSIIPNIVGVDIGCGVLTRRLKSKNIDFAKLDEYIRKNIPLGFDSRGLDYVAIDKIFDGLPMEIRRNIYDTHTKAAQFLRDSGIKSKTLPVQQLGTLGGGNHFIEIEKGDDGRFHVTIHSGSRNFGLRVAEHYQHAAKKITEEMNIKVPQDLEYLPLSFGGHDYLGWLKVAQDYARYNRLVMLNIILRFFGEEYDQNDQNTIESVHNYISERDGIIRKGSISSHKDENVVIPLNMGAGIILGKGKGNRDYNFSAPHGAGRLYGRKDMIRKLDSGTFYSMEDYKKAMEGIFTTSINRETFDESPFAYKPLESIMINLKETVEIDQILKPVYNLKASGE